MNAVIHVVPSNGFKISICGSVVPGLHKLQASKAHYNQIESLDTERQYIQEDQNFKFCLLKPQILIVAPEIPAMKYLAVVHVENTGLIQSLIVNMQHYLGVSIHF